MARFLGERLIWGIGIIFLIAVLNFVIIHLVPGDPVGALIGEYPVPPGYVEQIRRDFGLDQPLLVQLWHYLLNLAQGNMGFSFANRQPVLDLLWTRAGNTLLLVLPSLVLSAIIGIALALAAAPRAGGIYDGAVTTLTLFGYSVPVFWFGQMLVLLFVVQLGLLPGQGMYSLRTPATGFGIVFDILWHMILPVFCLTVFKVAVVARTARASIITVLGDDYITTATAKGLSRQRILWHHVLPNAVIPVVTVLGYSFGTSLTGAILTETVFAWPGLGQLFVSSIANRDYPVLLGILLMSTVMVVVANVITDILYAVLDPRVRRSYESRHG